MAGRGTGARTQANTQWDMAPPGRRVDMAIASGGNGEAKQEDDEGLREEERNDQFRLIGSFSPINRTGGGMVAWQLSQTARLRCDAWKYGLTPRLPLSNEIENGLRAA